LHVHGRFRSATPAVTPAEARPLRTTGGHHAERATRQAFNAGDGHSAAGKNSNGVGSVYFEPPSTRADGTVVKGRWRATYVDLDGKIKRVSSTVYQLIWDDELAPIRIGRSVRLTIDDLQDYVQRKRAA
jgi:hypothetical protein